MTDEEIAAMTPGRKIGELLDLAREAVAAVAALPDRDQVERVIALQRIQDAALLIPTAAHAVTLMLEAMECALAVQAVRLGIHLDRATPPQRLVG